MFFLKELPTRAMLEAYSKRFPHMPVDAVAEALALLRRASLLLRALEAYFAEHGLSQLRFLLLIVIDREPDRDALKASEIAERLDVSRPVVTRTVQGMVDDGLLAVRAHDHDQRAKLVCLTKAGREKLDRVLPGYYQVVEAFMAEQEGQER